jgi:hypothetical protein
VAKTMVWQFGTMQITKPLKKFASTKLDLFPQKKFMSGYATETY